MTVSAALDALPARGAYVKTWRRLIDANSGRIEGYDPTRADASISRAFWPSDNAADVLKGFRKALHNRINARGGIPDSYGRRDTHEGRIAAYRDSRAVLQYRTANFGYRGSGFETAEARKRFPDIQARMTTRGED